MVRETFPPLLLYAKWHIMHKRISNWRMGGDFMHTMWCMTNPKRAKVTIACKALITPYREPTDTRYDMSPGKCGTYMIWSYTIWHDTIWHESRQVWDRYDMIRYDMSPGKCGTGMIWYDMIWHDMICTWLTYRRVVLYTLLPEGILFDLIIDMHLTLLKLCLKSQVWILHVPTYVSTR